MQRNGRTKSIVRRRDVGIAPYEILSEVGVGRGTHTPPHDKRNGYDIPFVGADVGALRKHATGMVLAPISAAISCCGAQNFAAAFKPPKF